VITCAVLSLGRRSMVGTAGLLALVLACAGEPTSPSAPGPEAGTNPDPEPEETPDPTLASLAIFPPDTLIDPGEILRFQIVADGGDASLAPPDLTWSTADPRVARFDAPGEVTAVDAGVAVVVARSGELADTARVRVRMFLDQISVGQMHTCGRTPRGAAVCWGANDHGELGTGDYESRVRPVRSAAGLTLSNITAAGGFTCGVATSGRGYCWGDGSMMELGSTLAAKTNASPVEVAGNHTFRSMSGSQMAHACGLDADGGAWCWGYNRFGMVGHGILRDEPEPVAVAGGHTFAALHSSFFRTCGIDDTGGVYCWGRGGPEQVGDPAAAMDVCDGLDCAVRPMSAATTVSMRDIAVGRSHTCTLGTDALVYCWGEGASGQLGLGGTTPTGVPTPVSLPGPAAAITVGEAHSCALTPAGAAYCWGDNAAGQLGDGSRATRDTPVRAAGDLLFSSLAAGFDQTCGVTSSGETYCWGRNGEAQLGRDPADLSDSSVPVRVGMH